MSRHRVETPSAHGTSGSEVGLTPYNSPGALCLLAGTDLTDGVWYPMGGFSVATQKSIRLLGWCACSFLREMRLPWASLGVLENLGE